MHTIGVHQPDTGPVAKGAIAGLQLPSKIYPVSTLSQYRGIYFLYSCGQLVYVGQAVNVHMRVLGHISEGTKQFDSFGWIPFPEGDLDEFEANYIIELKPPLNKSLPHGCAYKQIPAAKRALRPRFGSINSSLFYSTQVRKQQIGGQVYFYVPDMAKVLSSAAEVPA